MNGNNGYELDGMYSVPTFTAKELEQQDVYIQRMNRRAKYITDQVELEIKRISKLLEEKYEYIKYEALQQGYAGIYILIIDKKRDYDVSQPIINKYYNEWEKKYGKAWINFGGNLAVQLVSNNEWSNMKDKLNNIPSPYISCKYLTRLEIKEPDLIGIDVSMYQSITNNLAIQIYDIIIFYF